MYWLCNIFWTILTFLILILNFTPVNYYYNCAFTSTHNRKRTREVLKSSESENEDGNKKVKEDEKDTTSDIEYSVTMETSDQEDETTISEQEEHEVTEDHSNEINALQQEGNNV